MSQDVFAKEAFNKSRTGFGSFLEAIRKSSSLAPLNISPGRQLEALDLLVYKNLRYSVLLNSFKQKFTFIGVGVVFNPLPLALVA